MRAAFLLEKIFIHMFMYTHKSQVTYPDYVYALSKINDQLELLDIQEFYMSRYEVETYQKIVLIERWKGNNYI